MNTKPVTIRLLIVEDDEDDYFLTNDLLQEAELYEFIIDWVIDAEQVRRHFHRNNHDICLMDYQLGAEVGVSLVREASSLGFSAPIIMLTGQDNIGVEVDAAEAGAVDYLIKENLTLEQLLRSIRYALARKEIETEKIERLRAESANKSKTDFMANLSHEIRTPLTSIIGYSEILVSQYQQHDLELSEKLSVINRNGKHLLSLLNGTLDLSKIEAGKLEIDIEKIEFIPFLGDIVAIAQAAAVEKKLDFNLDLAPELPTFIHSDPLRLRQILLNLISNACKYTQQGCISISVAVIEEDDGHCIMFKIKDSGEGIEAADLENIFTPFYQSHQGIQLNSGSGLGLTISQKLAQKLNGEILLTSELGRGSTFTFSLKNQINMAELSPTENIQNLPSHYEFPDLSAISGRILIADDVPDIRNLLGQIMEKMNLSYDFCQNGQEVVSRILDDKQSYCLILMDLNMPVMDGYEALQALRENKIEIPIVALTADSMQREREKCLKSGFSAYIPKPISAKTLCSTITDFICTKESNSSPEECSVNLLVIEDDPDANLTICHLLDHLGYTPHGALNLEEALNKLKNYSPQLVLMDFHLGSDSGIEVAAALKEIKPDLEIILMSGDERFLNSGLPAPFSTFLLKPASINDLQSAIHKYATCT